jgi:hypothetical protein
MDTARLHRTFVEAKPFPHVVIENFLEPAEAQTIATTRTNRRRPASAMSTGPCFVLGLTSGCASWC